MTATLPRSRRLLDWIDERTNYRALMVEALDEPIPGGARWAYVFGSALLSALALQAVTGILLTIYYVPSVDHAHTTVAYVQKEVPLGWLVRGVHYYGASAVMIILLLHLIQVFLWGAYKGKREGLWLAGVILLNLVLGFGFTGYLLPWDQKAYFGTQVAGGIAGSVPLVGEQVSRIVLGGSGVGQATLSRFFTTHVFLLPAATVLLIVVHIYLFRFRGPAGPLSDDPKARERVERFFPMQLFKDTVATIVVVVLLCALAFTRPALLGPKADPAASFVPRPEWYFLWAFQLLKVMPAFLGGVVAPGILMTGLALVPFVDRSDKRSLRSRAAFVLIFAGALGVILALTSVAFVRDARDEKIAQQEEAARAFMAEPFEPDKIGVKEEAKPAAEPPLAFTQSCAGCHGANGEGQFGPKLHGLASKPKRSKEDLEKLLVDPAAYGLKPTMPAFPDMPEEDRRAIAEWIVSLK